MQSCCMHGFAAGEQAAVEGLGLGFRFRGVRLVEGVA